MLSKSRTLNEERRNRYAHKRGSNGRNLCRWCGTEVTPPRRTYCSDACIHEWRLRSDPGYLRSRVFERDRGICALCGTDTTKLTGQCAGNRYGSLWDADHIIPVAEGGGECDLSNIRTLCIPCHRKVTAELRKRLRRR